MNKHLLLILLGFGLVQAEEKLKPLSEIIAGEIDEGSASYVTYRCLGLYGMVNQVTGGSTQDNSQTINAIVQENIKKMLMGAYGIWQRTQEDTSYEAFEENVGLSVPPIATIYQEIANDNWIKNGNYIEGNDFLISELQICNSLIDRFPDSEE